MRFIDKVAQAVIDTQGDSRAVLDVDSMISPRIHPLVDRLDDIDDAIANLQTAVNDLASRVDALENTEPEPEPEPPPPEVGEEYPANPDLILQPGASQADIDSALSQPGRIVEFLPGSYGDRTINPAESVHAFSRTPYGAHFQAATAGQKDFVRGGGSDVTLDGFKVDRYCIDGGEGASAIHVPASRWLLDRVEIVAAVHGGIRLANQTTVRRALIHDCGRYGWSGGNNSLLEDVKVWRLCIDDGTQLVPRASDSNRGVCKMAGGSTGNHIQGLEAWNIDGGMGLWWDGARDGSADDVYIHDVSRVGVSVEVCWGGAEHAPPGKTTTWPDPAFVITNVRIEDQHNANPHYTGRPEPSGLSNSMSPGVWWSDIHIENVGGAGIGVIYSGAHSVFDVGYPAQNISGEWAQSGLRNENVRFEDFELAGTTDRFVCGVTSGGWSGTPGSIRAPYFASGGPARYGMTPERFGWGNDTDLSLSEWLALGHT